MLKAACLVKVILPLHRNTLEYVNDNKKLAECEKALEQFSSTQCPLLLEKVQSGTLDNVPLEMKVHCGTN